MNQRTHFLQQRVMNAIVNTRHGSADVLRVEERPAPLPKKGEVRIRVAAAGLNPSEVNARQGMYPDAPPPPMVVGYEVSGIVESLGEGAEGFEPGDRVWALCRFGGHAEVVCTPASWVRRMPVGMSFEAAAAIPVAYATAIILALDFGRIRSGDTVLLHMASGSVGLAVLELCRGIGGVTVIGAASAGKHEALRKLGLTHAIDPAAGDFEVLVRELTNGRGVDVVLDPIGGRNWKKNYRLLAPLGRLMVYGFSGATGPGKRSLARAVWQLAQTPVWVPLSLMEQNRAVMGLNMGRLFDQGELISRGLDTLARLAGEGAIDPVVDSVYPFSQVADAHRRLESRRNLGKVVLVPDGTGDLR
jgi:synaptic vesicle membrane protein VAT-1